MVENALIAVVGLSHTTAPIAVRERYAVSADALPLALRELSARCGSAVLLSTCNRTELYVGAGAAALDTAALARAFAGLAGEETPPEAVFAHQGNAAARHLLRVAAGLDSMVLGEDQILGQVRGAFIAAVEARTTDRLLSRLFHAAIGAGRRVRAETSIGRHARSVSAAAVEAVRSRLGDLTQATVLVIGAGEAGKLTARGLAAAGVGRLIVASRTHARARSLAGSIGGVAVESTGPALAHVDAVVSASAAPGYQLTAGMVRAVRGATPTKPLLLVDIAVPRDIDPALADEPGVTLLDIDGLHAATGSHGGPHSAVAAAEAIVREELDKLSAWWETLSVVPTITALREHAEAIRQTELNRTFGRMPDLAAEERRRIEALTAAIVNKLLHQPIARLKQPGSGDHYAAMVNDLFDLPPVVPEPADR